MSEHQLAALAEAWPLMSSVGADEDGLALPRAADLANAPLCRTFVDEATRRFPGTSDASALAVARSAWLGVREDSPGRRHADSRQFQTLAQYLHELASRYLERLGGVVALRSDSPASEQSRFADRPAKLERFRWLSLSLPTDLLIAALCSGKIDAPPPSTAPWLVFGALAELLSAPCAETHMHVGAATSFPAVWTSLMSSVASSDAGRFSADSKERGAPEPKRCEILLARCAFARLGFAIHLRERSRTNYRGTIQRLIGRWSVQLGGLSAEQQRALGRALLLRSEAAWPGELASLRSLFRRLVPSSAVEPRTTTDLRRMDPLEEWSPGCGRRDVQLGLPESSLAARAIGALRSAALEDEDLASAFWSYQRFRTFCFRYLTARPGTPGLPSFQRTYGRISGLRGKLGTARTSIALATTARQLNLASMEIRTAFPKDLRELKVELRAIEHAHAESRANDLAARGEGAAGRVLTQTPEIGLVFHFLKKAELQSGSGPSSGARRGRTRRQNAAPADNPRGLRFSDWFIRQRAGIRALVRALELDPRRLWMIRGIDVASDELAVPNWAVLPLYEEVRARTDPIAEFVAPGRRLGLRATAHLGEDFGRLSEGLRRLFEAVWFGLVKEGDRVGHAVALFWDPAEWAKRAGSVSQTKEERLLDLAWELECYAVGFVEPSLGRVMRVEEELRGLATAIFGLATEAEHVDAKDWVVACRALWRDLHSPALLARVGFPYGRVEAWVDPSLLHAYLSSATVHARGSATLAVAHDSSELDFLRGVQRSLTSLLARREITIETNPTSNLLIGDLRAYQHHGAIAEPASAELLISVNSDDPLCFATCLADEFAYLYHALLRSGMPATQALAKIDRLRRAGHSSRFTLPRPSSLGKAR